MPNPAFRYSPSSKCNFYLVTVGASVGRSTAPVKISIFQSGLSLQSGADVNS
ncbi:hypothetical protein SLW70_11955 [Flavobacterium sp. NG2]|uniref:hypothetical protein n=1 Tax=Flavobacterium sp. NG2 TaxID=3097547 RepID=UPI002A8400A8|nr:hypothetical protein [Flavobacterium sp. NG2]WPR70645.1 hypothetical protein SLW70_11955 [Flavobacterium sp. NG2]